MTYCLGLRTNDGVFIAADSAVSTPSKVENFIQETRTSFGEAQGEIGAWPLGFIVESGLKVAVDHDVVLGFAGHMATARAFVDAYLAAHDLGHSAGDSIEVALRSVTPCSESAHVLVGYCNEGESRLIHINIASNAISDVDRLIQLGSVPDEQCEWTDRYINAFTSHIKQFQPDPIHAEHLFTQLVALLQSYGVHDRLMPHGVGGAFIAGWVTPRGARWQGDHLFVVHDSPPDADNMVMCSTMVRENVLCLVNNQTGANKLISWPLKGESFKAAMERASKAGEACLACFDKGRFDYFVSINRARHLVTVIEMCRQEHHQLVSLCSHYNGTLGIGWTEELLKHSEFDANDEGPSVTLIFHPFSEPSESLQAEAINFCWSEYTDRLE